MAYDLHLTKLLKICISPTSSEILVEKLTLNIPKFYNVRSQQINKYFMITKYMLFVNNME